MEIGTTEAAFALSRQYGYLTVFVFVFLETSMLFGLLRSEVAVPFTTGVIVTDLWDRLHLLPFQSSVE
jgi:membrane protein DedA with SNARE-associated domain